GTRVTLNEFGLTSAIVFTSDFAGENSLIGRSPIQAHNRRQLAAQWTYYMAQYELERVLRIEKQLESQGHTLPDGEHLLEDVQSRLKTATQHWDNRLFSEANHEGQRALRPLRIIMRAQWDQAVNKLDTPVASPFAIS